MILKYRFNSFGGAQKIGGDFLKKNDSKIGGLLILAEVPKLPKLILARGTSQVLESVPRGDTSILEKCAKIAQLS
jgi:hypothetical protein